MRSKYFSDPQLALRNLHFLFQHQNLVDVRELGANEHVIPDASFQNTLNTREFMDFLERTLSNQTSHFLGAYAESIWSCYLQQNPRYKLIKQSLQVHDEGKTLGEFDFILKDLQTSTFIHQELAVKFYLGLPGKSAQQKVLWFGPNNIDRLDKKCAHLKQQQLALGSLPAASRSLKMLGIDELKKECVIKGRLFVPFNDDLFNQMIIDDPFTRRAASGIWLTFTEFIDWATRKNNMFRLLEKPLWICAMGDNTIDLKSPVEAIQLMRATVEGDCRSAMLQAVDPSSGNHCVIFVVPDNWMQHAYGSLGVPAPKPRQP